MRLELEQNTSSVPFIEKNEQGEAASELRDLLRDGIKAANAGNRSQARTSLLRVTELDPKNETAWLWLASISEFPEELLAFLSRVLEINPENERALEWAGATKSLLSKTFVQRGIDAYEENRNDFATQCFTQALAYDEQNQMAWLWMASLSDSNDGKITYLEKVLNIDPENEAALVAYKKARNETTKTLLREAQAAAVAGRSAEAKTMLKAILEEMPDSEEAWTLNALFVDTFEEKVASYEKVLSINPANAAAAASLESLRSLMQLAGTAPAPQAEPEPETESQQAFTSENYELSDQPEVDEDSHRSPTQDLEFPTAAIAESSFAETAEPESAEEADAEPEAEMAPEIVEEPVADVAADDEDDEPAAIEMPHISFAPDAEPVAENAADTVVENAGVSEQLFIKADPGEEEETTPEMQPAPVIEEPASVEEYFADQVVRETLSEPQPEDYFYFEQPEPIAEQQDTPSEEAVPAPAESPFDSAAESYTAPVSAEYSDLMSTVAEVEAEAVVEDAVPFSPLDSGIPMPTGMLEALDNGSAEDAFKTFVVERPKADTAPCPFCSAGNDPQAFVCQSCMAMLTLSDLEMLLANQHADKVMVREAVEKMEHERSLREFNENELTILGIGHLNLRNFQYGYDCLAMAAQINPNNVVLNGQVHALHIRLEEIKKHEETQNTMPKGRTILVVDDSPTVRKLIAGKLEKSGHEVFCAEDGIAAMSHLEGVVPDLVLLDITMPRMDGYEVCKRIRSNDQTKDVPVVMISGKDGFFDKVRGRMAGTSGYITKPFGPETLMKAVEQHLKADAQ